MINISIIPRATEKTYGLSKNNVYAFNVPTSANKQEIMAAVKEQFAVEVTGIKTLIQTGKAVRFSRGKRAHPGSTKRQNVKKAYVTLADGNSIKMFDEKPAEEKNPSTTLRTRGEKK